ncbi:MAG: YHS domain-containing protein [Chloroflexi bacterium]|nr:YHS domain-containing protein [Chloroflexota bacterium]
MASMDTLFQNQGTATDPVCKMTVDKAAPPGGTAEHGGATYYFCSTGCQHSFVEDPAKFL